MEAQNGHVRAQKDIKIQRDRERETGRQRDRDQDKGRDGGSRWSPPFKRSLALTTQLMTLSGP